MSKTRELIVKHVNWMLSRERTGRRMQPKTPVAMVQSDFRPTPLSVTVNP